MSSYNSPFGGPNPDVSLADRFKAEVTSLSRSAPRLSLDALLAQVVLLWRLLFAKPIRRLLQKTEILERASTRACAKAQALRHQLASNEIPEFVNGKTTFAPPCGFWGRLVFDFLLAVALVVSVAEGLNFAWFVRFLTDSFIMGLLYAIPVFCVPAAEGALLLILKPGERARKMVALVQGFLVIVAGLAYAFLSLAGSDGSMAAAFADSGASISLDSWRMGFQLVTSVNVAALCLHAAFAVGSLTPTKNPLRAEKENELEALEGHIDRLEIKQAEVQGDLDEGEAIKEEAILFCKSKYEQLEALREETDQIRNQPL